jgi:hypothetical protein
MRADEFSEYNPDVVRRLRSIEREQAAIVAAQERLDGKVRQARNNGVTWSQIGHVLGTTRQAAQIRFRDVGADRKLAKERKAE